MRASVDQTEAARNAIGERLDTMMASCDGPSPPTGPGGNGRKSKGAGKNSSKKNANGSSASGGRKSISAEEQARKDFDASLAAPLNCGL